MPGILEVPATQAILGGVLALSLDIGAAHLDHVQLVAANSSIKDLPFSGLRIEAPEGALPEERDRKWPILLADDQDHPVRALTLEFVRSVVCRDETVFPGLVGDGIAGTD